MAIRYPLQFADGLLLHLEMEMFWWYCFSTCYFSRLYFIQYCISFRTRLLLRSRLFKPPQGQRPVPQRERETSQKPPYVVRKAVPVVCSKELLLLWPTQRIQLSATNLCHLKGMKGFISYFQCKHCQETRRCYFVHHCHSSFPPHSLPHFQPSHQPLPAPTPSYIK